MLKYTATATALVALMAAPAFAQSTTAPVENTPPAASDRMNTTPPAATPSTKDNMTAPAANDGVVKPRADTPMNSAPETFADVRKTDEWRASKIIGSSVEGQGGASIGDVNEVLVNTNGQARFVVIGVGGFLGIGEKDVAVPFNQLSILPTKDGEDIEKITVTYSKEELNAAPSFKYDTKSAARSNKDRRSELAPSR